MPVSRKDVSVALSVANLCLLRVWQEIFAVGGTDAYFVDVSNVDVLAAAANLVLLTTLFLAATAVGHRFGACGHRVIVVGFVGVIAVQLSGVGPMLSPGVFAVLESWREGRVLDALAPPALLLAIVAVAVRWPQRSLRAAVGLVLILTPLAVLNLGRAAWVVLAINPSDALAAEAPAVGTPVASTPGPRVVVMVMDALSRYHAVEGRPDSIALPEFDRLRAQSVDATNVSEFANKTILALPALLSGLDITHSEPTAHDELLLTVDGATIPWSEAPNLIDDARALGGIAVLTGWYHPYCRLFPDLDGCSTYPTRTVGSRGRHTGFWRALRDQQVALVPYVNLRARQIDIVRAQSADAETAVTLGERGLIFLHLIAPHTPWIWDGEDESFTVTEFGHDGYFGNIQLMDRVLGNLRRKMEAAGKWEGTAVLLTSDHAMRYRPDYLKEPDDDRVPLILKLPGQSQGVVYDRPLGALVAHEMIERLLRGELQTPADVLAWLDRQ